MNEIDLTRLPHSEARALLATGVPVYLLVNPIEYHGPHLPLKNDHLLSLGMARELHQKLNRKLNADWPFVQTASLHLGAGPAKGPGTIATPYFTLKKTILESADSLIELGARKVVLMTFHGDPLHNIALDHGVKRLHSAGIPALAPFSSLLKMLLTYRPGTFDHCFDSVQDPAARKFLIEHVTSDFHAGFFETSLMLHFWPDSVAPSYRNLPACPEGKPHPVFKRLSALFSKVGAKKLGAELDFAATGLGWVTIPDRPGYSSSPHLATAEAGKAFTEEVLKLFSDATEQAFTEVGSTPEPLLKWLSFGF